MAGELRPAIKLSRISKRFGGVMALHDLSFEVMHGEVHALVGENGAGKSTLIKIMSGAQPPDSGLIEIGGVEHAHLSAAQALAAGVVAVHQEFNLLPELTVAENITLAEPSARWFRPIQWRRRQQQAAQILARINAGAISVHRLVKALTVSEQQLVEIAKALTLDARVLILDEPTAVLGDRETNELFGVIRAVTEAGTSIVYVSHRLEEVFQIADRVTVIKDGKHVATSKIRDTNAEELVRQMVGRPLSAQFPAREYDPGPVVLEVRSLSIDGLLRDVSFEVRAGEIVGLAGLSGSGRTTICHALVGLLPRAKSAVRVGSASVPANPRGAAQIGMVLIPEDRKRHGLFLSKSVTFNLALPSHGAGDVGFGVVSARAEGALASRLMGEFDIKAATPAMKAFQLSGGNQQKMVLAKWLSTKPRLVLLDEPTRGVDVGAKAEIYRLIAKLKADGVAIVLASSELPELLGMCDRILVLCQGEIAAEMPVETATEESIIHSASGLGAMSSDA